MRNQSVEQHRNHEKLDCEHEREPDCSTRRAIDIVSKVFQHSSDFMQAQRVGGGITNTLICVTLCNNNKKEHKENNHENYNKGGMDQCSNKVLVRFFGDKSHILINRSLEFLICKQLAHIGLCKQLYLQFQGGQVEQWIPGKTVTLKEMVCPKITSSVSQRLSHLHSTALSYTWFEELQKEWNEINIHREQFKQILRKKEFNDMCSKSILWIKILKWITFSETLLKQTNVELPKNKKLTNLLKIEQLYKIFFKLCEDRIEMSKTRIYENSKLSMVGVSLSYDIVLGHNDLLPGNILRNVENDSVEFIDYEYAGPSERAFDIANYFCECCGFECDWSLFPNELFQRAFIKHYLKELNSNEYNNSWVITDLLEGIKFFTKISHLFWGTWAIVQAFTSKIDFDYTEYALRRLGALLEISKDLE